MTWWKKRAGCVEVALDESTVPGQQGICQGLAVSMIVDLVSGETHSAHKLSSIASSTKEADLCGVMKIIDAVHVGPRPS